jgi:hypothetical protein
MRQIICSIEEKSKNKLNTIYKNKRKKINFFFFFPKLLPLTSTKSF